MTAHRTAPRLTIDSLFTALLGAAALLLDRLQSHRQPERRRSPRPVLAASRRAASMRVMAKPGPVTNPPPPARA